MNEEEQIFTTIHNLKYYNSVFQKFYNQDNKNDKNILDNNITNKILFCNKPLTLYHPENMVSEEEINKSLPFFNPYYNYMDSLILKQIFRHLFSNRGIDFGLKVSADKMCELFNTSEKQIFRIETDNFKLYILKQLDDKYKKLLEENNKFIENKEINIVFNAKINKVKPYAIFFDIPELSIQDSIHVACLGGCIFKYNHENTSLYNNENTITYKPQQIIKIKIDKVDLVKREVKWVIC